MDLYKLFFKVYESYTSLQIVLEGTAAFFGLLSVYFSIKKNIWVYPTGIVSTVLYVYILLQAGLLGDMMINFYYSIMSMYGWFLWSRSSTDQVHVQVNYAKKKDWLICSVLFVLSFILVTLIYYYKPFFDQQFSTAGVKLDLKYLNWANWLDVCTTSLFLVGMWLMAKRKIENWYFWIVGDLISFPMYLHKDLGITAILYFIYAIMAYIGLQEWKKNASVVSNSK